MSFTMTLSIIKKLRFIVIPSIVIALSVIFIQSLLASRFYELRVSLLRERILSLEFSTRIMQNKILYASRLTSNYEDELASTVQESRIMNSDLIEGIVPSYWTSIGLYASNFVRLISFRPTIEWSKDKERIILLTYAFFMERNKRYKIALNKYDVAIKSFDSSKNDLLAFALLHKGYLLTILGEYDKAEPVLRTITKDFVFSSYMRTAEMVLDLITRKRLEASLITKNSKSTLQKARDYFEIENYSNSCREYDKIKYLSNFKDIYYNARCKEEIGDIVAAVKKYKYLIEAKKVNINFKKNANRRLLLIGNFYHIGKALGDYAEKKAYELKDTSAVKKVKKAVKKSKQTVLPKIIVKKPNSQANENENKENDTTNKLLTFMDFKWGSNAFALSGLQEELEQSIDMSRSNLFIASKLEQQEEKIAKEVVVKVKPTVTTKPTKKTQPKRSKEVKITAVTEDEERAIRNSVAKGDFWVYLQDGRRLSSNSLYFLTKNNKILIQSGSTPIEIPISRLSSIFTQSARSGILKTSDGAFYTFARLTKKKGKLSLFKQKGTQIPDQSLNVQQIDKIYMKK